jgi:hypothetical protein
MSLVESHQKDSGPVTLHEASDSSNKPCRFFRLPRELRDIIYTDISPVEVYQTGPDTFSGPGEALIWHSPVKVSNSSTEVASNKNRSQRIGLRSTDTLQKLECQRAIHIRSVADGHSINHCLYNLIHFSGIVHKHLTWLEFSYGSSTFGGVGYPIALLLNSCPKLKHVSIIPEHDVFAVVGHVSYGRFTSQLESLMIQRALYKAVKQLKKLHGLSTFNLRNGGMGESRIFSFLEEQYREAETEVRKHVLSKQRFEDVSDEPDGVLEMA